MKSKILKMGIALFLAFALFSAFGFAHTEQRKGPSGLSIGPSMVVSKELGEAIDLPDKLSIDDVSHIMQYVNETKFLNCIDNELKNKLIDLYLKYQRAIATLNAEEINVIIEELNQSTEKIKSEIRKCMGSEEGITTAARQHALNQQMRETISTYVEKIQNLSLIPNESLRAQIRDQIKEETMTKIKEIVTARSVQGIGQEIKAVVSIYKEALEGLKEINDTQIRKEMQEEIKNQTMAAIREIISEKKKVDASEILPVAIQIEITPIKLKLGEEEMNSTGLAIKARIQNRTVQIESIKQRLTIKDGDIAVEVPKELKISINENGTMIGNTPLSIAPMQVKEKLQEKIKKLIVRRLEIRTENNTPIYTAEGKEMRKILGIIPVTIETKAHISAETGEIKKIDRPWWTFLTTE